MYIVIYKMGQSWPALEIQQHSCGWIFRLFPVFLFYEQCCYKSFHGCILVYFCKDRCCCCCTVQFSSVTQSCLTLHGLQHARLPCPSPTPRAYSNSCPLSHWCHPIISSSVISFSSCLQSFPASGSFQMSQFFASGCQRIGVSASASVLEMNIQD